MVYKLCAIMQHVVPMYQSYKFYYSWIKRDTDFYKKVIAKV